MLTHYTHAQICSSREAFALGLPLPFPLRSEILTSWKQAQRAGLAPDQSPLSPCLSPLRENISPRHLFLGREFVAFVECLKNIGGVFFLLYEDKTIFCSGGDPALLSTLFHLGIGEGFQFTEETIGTSAPILLREGQTEAWVIGAEHYLERLSAFASYAAWSRDPYSRYMSVCLCPVMVLQTPFFPLSATPTRFAVLQKNCSVPKPSWLNSESSLTN